MPYPGVCAGSVWPELSDTSRHSAPTLFLAVRAVTFPVVSGRIQMSVLNYQYCYADILDRSIPAIAVPSGSVRRVSQVSVHRYLDGNAGPIDCSIPVIACPARSIRSVCQESVRRHLNGDAGFINRSIPAMTLPSFAGEVQISIWRHIGGRTGPIVLPKTSTAPPTVPIG
jgi:hypothetical protein